MQSLEIISVNIWQIVISLCNLLILYLLFRRFLYAPVQRMISERENRIRGRLDEAEREQAEAASLRAAYDEKLGQAAEEGDRIVKAAVQRARQQEEEILSEAELTAARTRERAEEQIALERKHAVNELKDDVAGMAVDLASAVIGKNLTEEDNRELIDRFLEDLDREERQS